MVFDANQALIMANSAAETLFGISSRDAGRQLQDLEMSYHPVEIRSPINQLISDRRPLVIPEVAMTTPEGNRKWFDVRLAPLLDKDGMLTGIKVAFQDVTHVRELAEALQQSSSDLEAAYEQVQSSNEELETTNEELQSSNEEMETTNEELQSTNEELETMNEELQSTNEELESVNDELRNRGEELNQANTFFQSVLRSLRVGVIVVDHELNVMEWNGRADDMWGIRTDEAVGSHILNLDIGLRLEQFLGPIRESLVGNNAEFEAVVPATNRRGRGIMCRVIINPLFDPVAGASGAVILMDEVAVTTDGENA
jgi:two-component system CheB/CheR fusion protein